MNDTLERITSTRGEGNFWRRLGALLIDWGIVGVALCVIAAVGYGLTKGQVRMAQAPLAFTTCLAASEPPSNFDPAAPIPGVAPEAQQAVMGDTTTFRADVVTDCRVSMMGSEINRQVTIQENAPTQRYYSLPVSTDYQVTRPWIYLDHVYSLVMILALTLMEGVFGFSLGKRVTGLKVQRPNGGPAGVGRALVRNLVLWGPGAVVGLIGLGAGHNLFVLGDMTGTAMGLTGILLAFALWPFALLMGLLASNAQPFWDQLAGVRVVRA